ncbi:anti-sigma factor family protein [Ramlibacter pinisoli]|uniref:Anti-sigma factor n=2 Tax=Ramlibacter TaxID=174951 RepID=A0A6N8IZR7_9BURK|nr:anti-sigma factor [Ramlibacter pinisoli]MBA2962152.1 anti-sigma factor [Ramlibacter sp. CGMCC 1.13660]MVQ32095.1 anti-sigma factor [Ramlibacter pinisoli]
MDPRLLNAFVDGELELERQLALERDTDAVERAAVERLRALRTTVREHASYHAAPPELRDHVQALLRAEVRPSPALPRRRWAIAWPSFVAGAAALALVLASVQWLLLPQQDVGRIQGEVLASHARAIMSGRLVDVASSDHHTVKPWLSGRLDFSPPVSPPLGSELLGARVDFVDGRPVAVLVLRHAGHVAESYAWPVAGADEGVVLAQQRGFQLAGWTAHGMRRWLVSDLNPQEFAALVRDLRAQD